MVIFFLIPWNLQNCALQGTQACATKRNTAVEGPPVHLTSPSFTSFSVVFLPGWEWLLFFFVILLSYSFLFISDLWHHQFLLTGKFTHTYVVFGLYIFTGIKFECLLCECSVFIYNSLYIQRILPFYSFTTHFLICFLLLTAKPTNSQKIWQWVKLIVRFLA